MRTLTLTLAAALLVSVALNIAARRMSSSGPGFEYFPDMARTARYNAFETNPNFDDNSTLRVPPPGTIPRGMLPLSSDPTSGADGTPVNPFPPEDPATLARGAIVFNTFCVPCHSAGGEGNGLVVQHGFPPPPSLLEEPTRSLPDAEIFDVITNGLGLMPSHAAQISREDRWRAVLHLRKLQNQHPGS